MSGLVELERTLALIKPDAIGSMEEIIRLIKNSGFSILGQRRVSLSPEQVSDFYSEHYGKVSKLEFLNTIISFSDVFHKLGVVHVLRADCGAGSGQRGRHRQLETSNGTHQSAGCARILPGHG